MIKTNIFKKTICFIMAAVMLFCVTVMITPVKARAAIAPGAAGAANDGVDFTDGEYGLLNPQNHIYYGIYDHATAWNADEWHGASAHEGRETPVLWRIVGEDKDENGTDDGKITLLSEFVLDSIKYFSEVDYHLWFEEDSLYPGPGPGMVSYWRDSNIRAWLNNGGFTGKSSTAATIAGVEPADYSSTGFLNSFTAAELSLIPTTSVHTSAYDVQTTQYISNSTIVTSDKIFLPWGIHYEANSEDKNTAWYGAVDRINNNRPPGGISGNERKTAYLKNDADSKTRPIPWWLRSPQYVSEYAYPYPYFVFHVQGYTASALGRVATATVDCDFGIRPVLKLNPQSVIFASEIKSSANASIGKTAADDNYAAADGSKNFKLTVLGDDDGADVGILSDVPDSVTVYKTAADNEIHNAVTGLTAEPSYANEDSNVTGYTVNYKIIDDSGETRKIIGCGFSDYDKDLVIDASALTIGETYDAYVWLQRNNEINSHEGTQPQLFQLHVQELQEAPTITAGSVLVHTDIIVETGEADDTYANAVRKILFGEAGRETELSEGTGFVVDGNKIKILAANNRTAHSALNIKLIAKGYTDAATTVTTRYPAGGGSTAPNRTLPAADGKVKVEYTQSGETATLTLPTGRVSEIIGRSNGTAVLDLSGIKNTTTATLPTTALTAFSDAGLDVEIILPQSTITLDGEAAASLAEQAGDNISVQVKQTEDSALTPAQRESVRDGDVVFDISIMSGSRNISTFSGTLTVTTAYDGPLPVGVWYLNDAGEVEKLDCTYNAATKTVSFALNHLSIYIVGQDMDTPVWGNPFSDVKESDWFYAGAEYVVRNGLFHGTSDTTFSPNATMTRGMMVTVLWRMAGSPAADCAAFIDVSADAYYAAAVGWAAGNVIVSGVGQSRFAPNDNITREQMAVMLYNYAKAMDITVPQKREGDFSDKSEISAWAKDAVNAMYSAEILNGKGGNNFHPQGNVSRAEAATMYMHFLEAVN